MKMQPPLVYRQAAAAEGSTEKVVGESLPYFLATKARASAICGRTGSALSVSATAAV
jgi:hypothetical protein